MVVGFCSISGYCYSEFTLGFENTSTVSGKWNEDVGSVQDFIFWFCFWCKPKQLGGRVIPRFPWVTTVMESFSSDLLWAKISYWTESHLESCQTSTMELFCENSQQPKDVDYFRKCSTGFWMRLQLERSCKCGLR